MTFWIQSATISHELIWPSLPLYFSAEVSTEVMFYDLNVPYSPDDPEVPHTLNFLAERKST